ncbi:MAG: hypothetical protein J6S44_00125 [Clostridia bacterium]|nr:hypothetical protein [Clostridia bacterium]
MIGVFFILSLAALAVFIVIAACKGRHYVSSRILTPYRTVFAGVFVSATLFFFPLYWASFAEKADLVTRFFKTLLISVHHTIRLFIIDTDFDWIRELSMELPTLQSTVFSSFAALLFILAPFMTFGVILSFFQNFTAYVQLFLHPFTDLYIFSELSERSLALATDIKKNHKVAAKRVAAAHARLKEAKKQYKALSKEKNEALDDAKKELAQATAEYGEAKQSLRNAGKCYKQAKKVYAALKEEHQKAEEQFLQQKKSYDELKSSFEENKPLSPEDEACLAKAKESLDQAGKDRKQTKDRLAEAEKKLHVAEKNAKDVMVLFADVFEQNTEDSYELLEKAKGIRSLCFKKDILSLRLRSRSKKSVMRFFLISETEEEENIKHAMTIAKDPSYSERENVTLYVFSTGAAGELLLSSLGETKVQVRRVEAARSLITYTLDQKGEQLFDNAIPTDTDEKLISALVVGVGSQGTEMIKALTWYCQMEGYRIEINAFDQDPLAEERFAHKCPELYSPACNGIYVEGEAQYKIKIHAGVSTDALSFEEAIRHHKNATFVFVSQGSDDRNIRTALDLRILFARMGKHPIIQAVVYNSDTKNALQDARNADGKPYDLDLIGDLDELFSEAVIVNSELEEAAAAIHLRYLSGDMTEEEHMRNLFRYEYNYRSSMASALHGRLRIKRGVMGAGKAEEDLTVAERDAIERIEHRRWNAYMRSEGFVYSGSPDKKSRNNLAKMHHNLVPFDVLSEEDKRKDSRVATK